MKKLTKKQKDALEYLVLDLDELSNKPRRLFSSFGKIVEAFIEKEDQPRIMADINEWEEFYYASIRHADVLEELGKACIRTKKEMREDFIKYHKDDMENLNSHMYTVSQVVKSIAKKMAVSIIDEVY